MKVLVVDDHPLILSALQQVIRGLGDDVEVLEAGSAVAAREQVARHATSLDLVLLDLALGDANGFDLLSEFRAQFPAVPVVVVSASDRMSDVIRSIDLGAMGFVPKRATNDVLFQALRMVMSGGIYVPAMSLGAVDAPPESDTQPDVMRPSAAGGGAPQPLIDPDYQRQPSLASIGLTPRQTDVLAQLLQGKPNKLIARELNLSVETVKDHVAAVLRALGVSSRTQAVVAVSQMTQRAGTGFQAWKPTQR